MSDLERIRESVKEASGIAVETLGRTALDRAVHRRMIEVGVDSMEAYDLFLSDNADEVQHLVETLVVPETWFFRDQKAFSLAVQHSLAPNRRRRGLRILSIPCSTGEEPYSIAMSLLDAGISTAFVQIDAVDISHMEIEWAKRAIYGRNSFRGVDLDFRDRHFLQIQKGYQLKTQVRDSVDFEQGNLFAPDFAKSREPYDIIFCRNLLIYFDADTQVRALQVLSDLLAEDGLIFSGPSEASIFLSNGFESSRVPRAFGFRRAQPEQPPVLPTFTSRPVRIRSAVPLVPAASALRISAPPSAPAEPIRVEASMERAARLADNGALSEAREVCEQHIRECGPTAPALYLLGLVKDAERNHESARECYRKALYLDPEHYESLVQLALINEQEGNVSSAAAFRSRAERAKRRERKADPI